ncbi:hypothetical protein ABZW30_38130 [Kitasatospora sp. NPDC004669]|uniref:hypothetical protein n=1 Tax=Kitasatospora sp. NPDC004669 TaxID=3154555 RepID=UPI0033BAEE4E
MYLVHAALQPVSPGRSLPFDARELLLAAVRPEDRIEHLVVHPGAVPDPVLGVYLLVDSLAEAEGRTAAFCRRALAAVPQFAGWKATKLAVPLVVPFYDRLLSAAAGPGRNGPGTLPSI